MAKKAKKVSVKVGDYVRVKKGLVGVVVGLEEKRDYDSYDEATDEYELLPSTQAYVATVDADGESDNNIYEIKKLVKIKAPEYVVVWSDEYSDPFSQFETKAEAEKFATKLRKNKNIVEVRTYKITK